MNLRSYPLRLNPSLREQVESLAKKEQISLNHFIALALAEKLSRMEHDAWLKTRSAPNTRPTHAPSTIAA